MLLGAVTKITVNAIETSGLVLKSERMTGKMTVTGQFVPVNQSTSPSFCLRWEKLGACMHCPVVLTTR